MGEVKSNPRTTKLGSEIAVGDTVYVAHSRTRWITVAEIATTKRGENTGKVWVRSAPSLPWTWLDADRRYPVRP